MKNIFSPVFVLTLIVLSTTVHSQLPATGYIGLFTEESHSTWCVTGEGFYPVEMWIWCLPSEHGMICAEFKINYPLNIIQSTMTPHPDIIMVTCFPSCIPEDGLSACKNSCQWDWNWFYRQLLYVTDPTQTAVEVVEFPDVGAIQFATCEEGYPVEPCIVYSNLYLNYESNAPECSGTAIKESSWGAIKSLCKE